MTSAWLAGLQQKVDYDGPEEQSLEAANLAQCVFPQRLPTSPQPDLSSRRYGLTGDIRAMYQQRRLTDLVLEINSDTWDVHRVVLASCSPLLEDFVQCLAPGTMCS